MVLIIPPGRLPAIIKSVFLLGAMVTAVVLVGKSRSPVPENQGVIPSPAGFSEVVETSRKSGSQTGTGREVQEEEESYFAGPDHFPELKGFADVQESESVLTPPIEIGESSTKTGENSDNSLQYWRNSSEMEPAESSLDTEGSTAEAQNNSQDVFGEIQSPSETNWIQPEESENEVEEELDTTNNNIASGVISESQEDREPDFDITTKRTWGRSPEDSHEQPSYLKNMVTDEEIERIAESTSIEALRQRAVLAARAASTASAAARSATEQSSIASEAAHDAVLAAGEAVAAAGAVQNALEIGVKSNVLLVITVLHKIQANT